ncbi:MAG: DUF3263 domain-containing protein [Aeromicrobium sp.]
MSEELSPVAQGIVDMVVGPAPFGDQDRAMLEFERLRFLTSGSKHNEILDRFAMTPVRYYIRLNWILNQPEAASYDPALVGHLVELREKRRAVRTVGTVAAGVATRPDARGTRPALLEVVKR